MNKLYLILLVLYSYNSFSQEIDCLEFKTGTFYYLNSNRTDKVIRNDSMQIEINLISGVEVHSSVKWIEPCKYIMTYEKIINSEKDFSDYIGQEILVDIIEVKENILKVHSSSNRSDCIIEFIKDEDI